MDYQKLLPEVEYQPLIAMLVEVDALAAKAFAKVGTSEKNATADLKAYLSLVSARVSLLTVAGLTPKSRKQITGEGRPAAGPTQEDLADNEFLDS